MSYHFYLYRAPANSGPMGQWEKMHAEPIGTASDLSETLSQLFPGLNWKQESPGVLDGTRPSSAGYQSLDITLREEASGSVFFIVMHRAVPSAMRQVMETLLLNHCYVPGADALVDPYAYSDEDRYFVRKGSGLTGTNGE